MRELAQLGRRLLDLLERLGQEGGDGLLLVLQGVLCQLQRDDRVDQPLLRSVVQIANHAPALLVGRRHDPRPRRRQLRPRFGVRDRRRDEVSVRRRQLALDRPQVVPVDREAAEKFLLVTGRQVHRDHGHIPMLGVGPSHQPDRSQLPWPRAGVCDEPVSPRRSDWMEPLGPTGSFTTGAAANQRTTGFRSHLRTDLVLGNPLWKRV